MLLVLGLQLPLFALPSPSAAQSVPAVASPAARPAFFAHAWTVRVSTTEDLMLAMSARHVLTAGPAVALEARTLATGDIAWTHALPSWQALVATDTLVLGISGQHAYALDAATGRTRWVTQTTGANTRLIVSGDRLLMMSDTNVLLRELSTGTPLWRVELTAPPTAAAIGASLVAVAGSDGTMIGYDLATSRPLWLAKPGDTVVTASAATPQIYAGLADGRLCSIRERDGRVEWCYPLRVPMAGPPVADERFVYAALLESTLRALERRDGAMARQDRLGHRPGAGPWLSGASLIVALTTGEFLVIDRATGRPARIAMPDAGVSQLLEQAVVAADGQGLASLTVAPGGNRRLSAYRPAIRWPVPTRVLPDPAIRTLPTPAPRPAP